MITVTPSVQYSNSEKLAEIEAEAESGWTQEIPDLIEIPEPALPPNIKTSKKDKNSPVELPAHLERALLNSQPVANDPFMLPLPHHVMLNHLYSRNSLYNTLILGLSIRYRENFITLVYYRPNNIK